MAGPHQLAYGPDPNQFGRLHLPAGQGPYPVVVFIHGGYWRARYGLGYAEPFCAAVAARGVTCWNVEYRRVGQQGGGWPGTFCDVAQAAGFVRRLAELYPLDLQRIVAAGHSAGGHLALWLAGAAQFAAGHPLHSPDLLQLRGVVALAPVADLQRAWELGLSGGAVTELLGGTPAAVPERYAAASPVNLLPLGLRQVFIHGSDDEDVPIELSQRYCQAAQRAGDDAALIVLPGVDHFEPVEPGSPSWFTVLQAISSLLT